ncbi:MAG: glutamine-hydrolyzing carbamoyl-phosphate synthase small subunit [Peptococcia bacterium]
MKAYLCLADGRIFPGESIGLAGETAGEVIFHTGMTGYQEILTDPNSAGQIITFTYPLIGNYGVNKEDELGKEVLARGIVIKEACSKPSNYRSEQNLHAYLVEKGVVGIKDVDTRALTRHLRTIGSIMGLISCETDLAELKKRAAALASSCESFSDSSTASHPTSSSASSVASPSMTYPHSLSGFQLLQYLSTQKITTITEGQYPIVIVDFGASKRTIQALQNLNCQLTVVPVTTTAQEILKLEPWGVVLSDGPGNPQDAINVLAVVEAVLERDIPLMGIGLGHQLLGLALGAKTSKLKNSHRGDNQPVKNLATGKVHITSQNHGFILEGIDPKDNRSQQFSITHLNLNDRTIEGIRHNSKPAFAVQFQPEIFPGAQGTHHLWEDFLQLVQEFGREKRGGQYA